MTAEEKNNLDMRKAVFSQVKIEKQNYFLLMGMLKQARTKEDFVEIFEHLDYFVQDCRHREGKDDD